MSARSARTQGLTEGAILAALVALFAIATRYLPLIGITTALLCPLPLAVLVIRHGFRTAAIASVVATLVAAMLAGPLVGLAILVSFAPIGLVLGIGARRGWPAVRTLLVASLVAFASTVLNYLGLFGGGRISMDEMAKTMERSVEMSASLYTRFGMSQTQIDAVTAQMRTAARLLPYLLPAILVVGALTTAWINYEVGRRVLLRFGFRWPALPPMRTWRVPAGAIWLLPLSFLLVAMGQRPGAPAFVLSIGWSLALSLQAVFSLQGLIAGWIILGNYGFGRLAQILAVVIAFSVPIMAIAVLFLGVLDSTHRVRERWGLPRAEPSGAGS